MTDLEHIVNHIRNRSYMSGIERESARVRATGEVFTPTSVAQHMLDTMDQTVFLDSTKTFLDNSCGDGQLISEVLIRKMENGSTFEQALSTVYGVDLMQDNVELCRERLLCGRNDLRHIVEQNIVCADALRYHYRFDGSHPYDNEVKEMKRAQLWSDLFIEES
jgi:2-polyprenyl-3-methyl-5-hydroxy-6-metoxy-1,4-benzoquinol methylase